MWKDWSSEGSFERQSQTNDRLSSFEQNMLCYILCSVRFVERPCCLAVCLLRIASLCGSMIHRVSDTSTLLESLLTTHSLCTHATECSLLVAIVFLAVHCSTPEQHNEPCQTIPVGLLARPRTVIPIEHKLKRNRLRLGDRARWLEASCERRLLLHPTYRGLRCAENPS
jgi:hypothetical protein